MANEIALQSASGQTVYVLLRNSSGQPFNSSTSAFEAYNAATYSSYALALVEQGTTGFYLGSVPAAVSAQGRYSVQAKQQAGAPALPSDTTVGGGVLLWSGAAEVDVLSSADKTGYRLDLAQAVPTSNGAQTVGDALCAARAQGFGAWRLSGTSLILYAPDGTTPVRQFTLDSATIPTMRT